MPVRSAQDRHPVRRSDRSPRARVAATPKVLIPLLEGLRDEMRARHVASSSTFDQVHPLHRRSAQNLVDYLTLRSHDIRRMQAALAELGVSSLGRAEEHVIRSIEQVIEVLRTLAGEGHGRRTEAAVAFGEGRRTLQANALHLLGPVSRGRSTRIMVTMPTEAAWDPGVARSLVSSGMECARINCAHDGPAEWDQMIGNLRRAAVEEGRQCPILMDLPGPKLRTGPIADGPRVLRLRPQRDARGVPVTPARVVLAADDLPDAETPLAPCLPVARRWLDQLAAGDIVSLHDTRGAARTFEITDVDDGHARALVWDTTYVETGTHLLGPQAKTTVGLLPAVEQALRVGVGDIVTLTADATPAPAAPRREGEQAPARFRIGCTLPAALDAVNPGHTVWFDDGKIGGRACAVRNGEVDVEITSASPGGTNLRAGRGINFPDATLDLPAISAEDEAMLRFVVERADIVGMSFAQRTADVERLVRQLATSGRTDIGIVLKIETAQGFHLLPELLLAGMATERLGVMVARGDLAVECGFERLAEIQDEMLWLCDAAHVPVIWATQVLDQMARTGLPSRAEVSDAAMAARAECVMLNKGPHIGEAVIALDDILRRMETHQRKKEPLLRRLKSWSPE